MATKTSVVVEPLAGPYTIAEGPHWDSSSQKLYFVDIINQKVHRLNPATGAVTYLYLDCGPVGTVVPVEGMPNKLATAVGTQVVLLTWDGESNVDKCSTQQLVTLDVDRKDTRVNDGKVDSSGRFWIGTMALEQNGHFTPDQGSLYSIDSKLELKKQISPVTISNGLAWNLKNDTFYYIDSPTYQIVAYNYDSKTATLSNKRTIFDVKKNNIPGLPDGMTVDADGNLWVALYGGEAVIQINPTTGKLLRTVKVPAKNVTSVAFGGPQLDILYITTSRYKMTESDLKKETLAGHLFAAKNLGVRGVPPNVFKLKSNK